MFNIKLSIIIIQVTLSMLASISCLNNCIAVASLTFGNLYDCNLIERNKESNDDPKSDSLTSNSWLPPNMLECPLVIHDQTDNILITGSITKDDSFQVDLYRAKELICNVHIRGKILRLKRNDKNCFGIAEQGYKKVLFYFNLSNPCLVHEVNMVSIIGTDYDLSDILFYGDTAVLACTSNTNSKLVLFNVKDHIPYKTIEYTGRIISILQHTRAKCLIISQDTTHTIISYFELNDGIIDHIQTLDYGVNENILFVNCRHYNGRVFLTNTYENYSRLLIYNQEENVWAIVYVNKMVTDFIYLNKEFKINCVSRVKVEEGKGILYGGKFSMEFNLTSFDLY